MKLLSIKDMEQLTEEEKDALKNTDTELISELSKELLTLDKMSLAGALAGMLAASGGKKLAFKVVIRLKELEKYARERQIP